MTDLTEPSSFTTIFFVQTNMPEGKKSSQIDPSTPLNQINFLQILDPYYFSSWIQWKFLVHTWNLKYDVTVAGDIMLRA